MRASLLPVVCLTLLSSSVFALPADAILTPDAIMARVAANQDKAQAERARYVYVQHARMLSRKGSRIMCEEVTDYRVTPTENGSHLQLLKVDGRVFRKGSYVHYDKLKEEHTGPAEEKDDANVTVDSDDTDRDLVENMRKNLLDTKSKDGIETRLFPLTTKAQEQYVFRLKGEERLNGRDVFHLVFVPKEKDDYGWKGDAYVDAQQFEPVLVTTGMARKIPFAVRTFLGTNLPGLGFTVVYAPRPDGVWFPASFSTEFKIRVLFFFRRDIVLNADNREFEKTHVESKILEGVTPVENPIETPKEKPQR